MWQTVFGDHSIVKHVNLSKMQVTEAHVDYAEYVASGGGQLEERSIDLHIHFVGPVDVSVTISCLCCMRRVLASWDFGLNSRHTRTFMYSFIALAHACST